MGYDLLIKGGKVLDPDSGLDGHLDVAIAGGEIATVGPDIPVGEARKVVDATGGIVIPGMIDLHVHSYWGATYWGTQIDEVALPGGVTTNVDAGSAGAHNFPGFRRYVAEVNKTRTLAYINISSIGLVAPANELADMYYANIDAAVRVGNQNRDLVVGVKCRINPDITGSNGVWPLEHALEAARQLGLPVMAHIARTPPALGEILALLRPGDVITHCFTARSNRIIDDEGRLRADVQEARARGVLLDVGHGMGSFNFRVARLLIEQGILPDTISSDVHSQSRNGPAYSLLRTVSKLLHLGMPLEDCLRATTSRPARVIGQAGKLGTLQPGAAADVTALELVDGEFLLEDCYGETVLARRQLVNRLTVCRGEVLYRAPVQRKRRS